MARAEPDLVELEEARREPSLALGLVAVAPLFLAYEWGLSAAGATMGRNTAEMLLTCGLGRLLGPHEHVARRVLVALLVLAAFVRVRLRGEPPLARALLRIEAEGALAALCLGPILIGLVSLCDVSPLAVDLAQGALPHGPSLAQAARLIGGAAWEELAFRVVAYSLVYLFVLRVAGFFGAGAVPSRVAADLAAIGLSALCFAAFHLELFSRWLGVGGEAYDGAVFLWRLFAGILLAGLFRWRGLGVVAWTHALFNLALILGADPGIFRAGG